jgi:hypothetical protein
VGALASAKLLAAGATWRLTGVPAAGHALLAAVTRGGEAERTLAGILLVKAGDRSVAPLTAAIMAGNNAPGLVDVLASIGTDPARDALVTVAQGSQTRVVPHIRRAATEALRTLDAIRERPST